MDETRTVRTEVVFPRAHQVAIRQSRLPPLADKQVRIEVDSSLISSGTEVAHLTGSSWATRTGQKSYPLTPGYSIVGRVVETTSEAIPEGSRVFSFAEHASYVQVDDTTAFLLERSIPTDSAIFANALGFGASAIASVPREALENDPAIAVVGGGAIAQCTAALLSTLGFRNLTLVSGSPDRRNVAESLGIPSLTPSSALSDKFTICIEATGQTAGITRSLEYCRDRGIVTLLGSPREPWTGDLYRLIHWKGVTMTGAHVRNRPFFLARNGDGSNVHDLISGMLQASAAIPNLRNLITHVVRGDDAETAYGLVQQWPTPAIAVKLLWRDKQ